MSLKRVIISRTSNSIFFTTATRIHLVYDKETKEAINSSGNEQLLTVQ